MRILGSSEVESVFLLSIGELALGLELLSWLGGWVPRGSDPPFRFPTSLPASLFILLIMSRTDETFALFGLSAVDAADATADDFSLVTLVISPDFRSTPTMDQGLGFGKGLGLIPRVGGDSSGLFEVIFDLGLASGEGEAFFSRLANFEDLRPTMEPPPEVDDFGVDKSLLSLRCGWSIGSTESLGENSFVGEVRLAARPVDLEKIG